MPKRCKPNYKWNSKEKKCEYDFPTELIGDHKVKICGVTKTRWRCPECHRSLDLMECKIHGIVEPIDLMNTSSEERGTALSYSILKSIEGKDSATIGEIANELGASKQCIKEAVKYIYDFQGAERMIKG